MKVEEFAPLLPWPNPPAPLPRRRPLGLSPTVVTTEKQSTSRAAIKIPIIKSARREGQLLSFLTPPHSCRFHKTVSEREDDGWLCKWIG
jgi:hypothetical protein